MSEIEIIVFTLSMENLYTQAPTNKMKSDGIWVCESFTGILLLSLYVCSLMCVCVYACVCLCVCGACVCGVCGREYSHEEKFGF